jgi:PAS domain S-box-containing protein
MKKSNTKKSSSFRTKGLSVYQLTLFMLVVTAFISVGFITFGWGYSEWYNVQKETKKLKESAINLQTEKLKTEVSRLILYLNHIEQDTSERTVNQIKNEALEYFEKIRFGNDGYVFVNTYDGFALLFDGRKLDVPTNMSHLNFPDNINFYKTEMDLAKLPDGGSFQYSFKKIDDDLLYPKISYIMGFDKWGWIIGAGDYLDNLDKEIAGFEKQMKNQLKQNVITVIGIFIGVLIILLFISGYAAKHIQNQFNNFVRVVKNKNFRKLQKFPSQHLVIRELREIAWDIAQAEERVVQFGQIIDQSLNEIYIFNQDDLHFVHVNTGARQNCGFSTNDLLKMTPLDLITNLTRDQFLAIINPLAQNDKEIVRLETFLRRKDNSIYSVDMSLTGSVFYEKPVFIAFINDITKQKETQENLLQSEQRYARLFENAPISLWEEDFSAALSYLNNQIKQKKLPVELLLENHPEVLAKCSDLVKVIDVNQHTLALYEASTKKELFGNLSKILTTKSYDVFKEGMIALYKGNPDYSAEAENKTLKGNELNLFMRWSFYNDLNSSSKKAIVSVFDLTDKLKAEKALVESKNKLESIFRASPIGIGVVTERIFTEVNQRFCEMTGYSREELLHKESSMLYPSIKEFDSVGKEKYRQISEKGTGTVETNFKRKDGKIIDVLLSSTPLNINDLKIGVTFTALDITEKKKDLLELNKHRLHLEEIVKERTDALEKSQEGLVNLVDDLNEQTVKLATANKRLAEINEELETFTYSVSHDLKAPLRGIDGYSQLLLENVENKLDAESIAFLNYIRISAEQMNLLIEDLLAYSRMERKDFQAQKVEIKPLIENLLNQLSNSIDEHKVKIIVDIPENYNLLVDQDGLTLILRNLLDNAIKFSTKGNKAEIEVVCKEDHEKWLIFVKDNGIGFEMKYHDRIFNIFQRLHLAEEYKGTGIGLAMVSKAVQRMNGKIWAESDLGKGATFYLEIGKKLSG